VGLHKGGGRHAVPPRAAQVVPRERLFARLGAKPIVVVTGTAGYGKSVLVSSWLPQSPPPGLVAWLTLDPADSDPGRLEWGETLTRREQAILRYLATNLSHAEIADAESISVNTVKTHTAHVYRKLGAANRRAAVRRSADLGLL
jgi:ATP/maltotriose-dependent transcriptional regulator MalT